MIDLRTYRLYLEETARRIDGLRCVLPITVEANMADKIQRIGQDDTPCLFYLPPSAKADGDGDAWTEQSECALFVMAKYNPRTSTSLDALELTQPIMERLKAMLVADAATSCAAVRVDPASLDTMAETEFFGNWAGWSVAFKTLC